MCLETHVKPATYAAETHVTPATYAAETPKPSECFGRIMVVKIWQPTRLLKMHMLIKGKVQLYYHTLLMPAFSKTSNDISSRKSYLRIT